MTDKVIYDDSGKAVIVVNSSEEGNTIIVYALSEKYNLDTAYIVGAWTNSCLNLKSTT